MKNSSFRLCYFANVRFPSERANSIQIVSMCSAFAEIGAEVTLFYPRRINRFVRSSGSLHAHYGVPENFTLQKLFSLDCIDLLPLKLQYPAFRLQSFTFGLRALAAMRNARAAVFYIRDNATLALAASFLPEAIRQRIFYEAHDFPTRARSQRALVRAVGRCGGLVSITRGLAERFLDAGIEPTRIRVAADGVDLSRFKELPDREEARQRLALPLEPPLAVYTGQLFPWKGVETLVRAAGQMRDWRIVILGGRPEDQARIKAQVRDLGLADRVLLRDQVPPGEVPVYLRAADLLVLPNSGRLPISSHYTSPMKLFEYMAAGRPIVASDLPSLREVLRHEENALLVPADDPEALAGAAGRLLTDPELKAKLQTKAAEDVVSYGWQERARSIVDFLRSLA